ncbi:hypothetical protein JCM19992_11290 [Thermostilla marina]
MSTRPAESELLFAGVGFPFQVLSIRTNKQHESADGNSFRRMRAEWDGGEPVLRGRFDWKGPNGDGKRDESLSGVAAPELVAFLR